MLLFFFSICFLFLGIKTPHSESLGYQKEPPAGCLSNEYVMIGSMYGTAIVYF